MTSTTEAYITNVIKISDAPTVVLQRSNIRDITE